MAERSLEDTVALLNRTPWRDLFPVHPAAELFPLLSRAELTELAADIKERGMLMPILVRRLVRRPDAPAGPGVPEFEIVDGRSRLYAMTLAGLPLFAGKDGQPVPNFRMVVLDDNDDPYEVTISANLKRRHLTAAQRREAIEKYVVAHSDQSDRQIGLLFGVHHTTIGAIRKKGEATGGIPPVERTTGADGRSRRVKRTPRPKRSAAQLRMPRTPITKLKELSREELGMPSVEEENEPDPDCPGLTKLQGFYARRGQSPIIPHKQWVATEKRRKAGLIAPRLRDHVKPALQQLATFLCEPVPQLEDIVPMSPADFITAVQELDNGQRLRERVEKELADLGDAKTILQTVHDYIAGLEAALASTPPQEGVAKPKPAPKPQQAKQAEATTETADSAAAETADTSETTAPGTALIPVVPIALDEHGRLPLPERLPPWPRPRRRKTATKPAPEPVAEPKTAEPAPKPARWPPSPRSLPSAEDLIANYGIDPTGMSMEDVVAKMKVVSEAEKQAKAAKAKAKAEREEQRLKDGFANLEPKPTSGDR
jgi:ParB-like chromosome segregation protein Spo0J